MGLSHDLSLIAEAYDDIQAPDAKPQPGDVDPDVQQQEQDEVNDISFNVKHFPKHLTSALFKYNHGECRVLLNGMKREDNTTAHEGWVTLEEFIGILQYISTHHSVKFMKDTAPAPNTRNSLVSKITKKFTGR